MLYRTARILFALLMLACVFPAAAQLPDTGTTVHSLTIDDALALGKKNNIAVKRALIGLAGQIQTNRAITASALPDISAAAGTQAYFQTPVTIVPGEFAGGPPGSTIAVSFQQKYAANAGVTLNQVLFDGQVFVGLKARAASIDYAQKAIELSVEQLNVTIYKVYYQLVVSKTQLSLIAANISKAEKLLSDSRAMFQNGFSEQLDVDKATVQLVNLQTTLSNTQTSIDSGYLGLKYLIGVPIRDSVVLTTEFKEEDLTKGISLDSAYRYEDRKDYQSMEIIKRLDDYNVKRYRAQFIPTLSLIGNYAKNAYANDYNFFTKEGNWFTSSYVGANLKVPIFSGFSKRANLAKAKISSDSVTTSMEDLKMQIDIQVKQARNSFLNAATVMANQRRNITLAESVYNQTKKKFESGLASNTDVTTAQTDLIQAQVNFVNALYQAVVAKVDYLKAIGKI